MRDHRLGRSNMSAPGSICEVHVSCWKDIGRRKRSCAFAAGDGLNRCHETHCRKQTTALADLSLAHRTVINCTSKTDEDRDVTFSSRAHASCCDWASPRAAHAPPPLPAQPHMPPSIYHPAAWSPAINSRPAGGVRNELNYRRENTRDEAFLPSHGAGDGNGGGCVAAGRGATGCAGRARLRRRAAQEHPLLRGPAVRPAAPRPAPSLAPGFRPPRRRHSRGTKRHPSCLAFACRCIIIAFPQFLN
jgi:hypothetical protein